jgi:capsule polysaccharide export protein KpsE/RkpR
MARSQVRRSQPGQPQSKIGDGIPQAAMESEIGRQLADQLRRLRRAEATMGENHPAIGTIREEIKQIETQLQAWLPKAEQEKPGGGVAEDTNRDELRQHVLRMSIQIQRLEARVDALEKRLEVF